METEKVSVGYEPIGADLKNQLHNLNLSDLSREKIEMAIDAIPEPVRSLIAPPIQDAMTDDAKIKAAEYLFYTIEDFQAFKYAIQDGPKAYVVYSGDGFASPRQQMLANASARGYEFTDAGGDWRIIIPKPETPAK